ncbi:MAG: GntR family transcriptional regulator [Tyzzerella sp.]|uniref:GntR family transcriptional regulator n=1 Tax=Candidatus Fimicola merdigallinarum TaxID=2840819 RepID=A0A9D9DVS1_9FIRM|nr:GntR family transcriptional regulator [Candidatus Fimicola merdigallinarum]
MNKKFDNNIPIYLQIIDEIKIMIASGSLKLGEKLPSVRELAQNLGVNPNTIQRAFSVLEQEGLVFAERTAGRYITNDEVIVMNLKENLATEELNKFLDYMKKIGFTKEEIIEKIKNSKRSDD